MFQHGPTLLSASRDTMSGMENRTLEPRVVRIAAAIGDPTRARMLGAVMDGTSLPAGDIARAANINASTASGHLAKLMDDGVLAVHVQGRHRYYRLADGDGLMRWKRSRSSLNVPARPTSGSANRIVSLSSRARAIAISRASSAFA